MKFILRSLVFAMTLAWVAGCASMEGDWQKAQSTNTIQGYAAFQQAYPDNPHKGDAAIAVDELNWREVHLAIAAIRAKGVAVSRDQESLIPSALIGDWVDATKGDQRLVVASDLVYWTRYEEGPASVLADQIKASSDGKKFTFQSREIWGFDYATRQNQWRPVSVEIMPTPEGQLRMLISGGQTQAEGYNGLNLAVTSPPKEYVFKRKS